MTKPSFDKLSYRVQRLLSDHGVTEVDEIIRLYPEGLLSLRGFGFKALREVEALWFEGTYYDPYGLRRLRSISAQA